LHLDQFEPRVGRTDLLKAFYFATEACRLSADDPRARLALANVSWERRLPLAVLYDIRTALEHLDLLEDAGPDMRRRIVGQLYSLRGLAQAYLRDLESARSSLLEAESCGLSLQSALLTLLLAAVEERQFDVAEWAMERLPTGTPFGGQAGSALLRTVRHRLLRLLRSRTDVIAY
jgi:hypothetical protein